MSHIAASAFFVSGGPTSLQLTLADLCSLSFRSLMCLAKVRDYACGEAVLGVYLVRQQQCFGAVWKIEKLLNDHSLVLCVLVTELYCFVTTRLAFQSKTFLSLLHFWTALALAASHGSAVLETGFYS